MNKILNCMLIVSILFATTMIIWLIYSINDLAKYQECLKTDSIPAWCEINERIR